MYIKYKPTINILVIDFIMKSLLIRSFFLVLLVCGLVFLSLIIFWNYRSRSFVSPLILAQPKLKFNLRPKEGAWMLSNAKPNTELQSGWDESSFCDEFMHKTFQQPVPVCTKNGIRSSVNCFGSKHSNKMVLCNMENVLMRPKELYKAMTTQQILDSNAIAILNASNFAPNPTMCTAASMNGLRLATELRDHVKLMVEDAVMKPPSNLTIKDCQKWVNEPTFLFRGIDVHVYFEFLSWYNLFKSILDEGSPASLQIIRMPVDEYKCSFAEFEQHLFSNVTVLHDMSDKAVCYRRLILVPSCYASLLFKCKGEPSLRQSCLKCNGSGRPQTDFQLFRSHVLKTCLLDDSYPTGTYWSPNNIVVILRKPYKRTPHDDPSKFERVLSNGDDLVSAIRTKFLANVTVIYPEDLTMCQQIRAAHNADILIGIHGAGLVHSWWLRENALLFELVPPGMLANPSFKMLCMLAGRHYFEYHIKGGTPLTVDTNDVLSTLTKLQR